MVSEFVADKSATLGQEDFCDETVLLYYIIPFSIWISDNPKTKKTERPHFPQKSHLTLLRNMFNSYCGKGTILTNSDGCRRAAMNGSPSSIEPREADFLSMVSCTHLYTYT